MVDSVCIVTSQFVRNASQPRGAIQDNHVKHNEMYTGRTMSYMQCSLSRDKSASAIQRIFTSVLLLWPMSSRASRTPSAHWPPCCLASAELRRCSAARWCHSSKRSWLFHCVDVRDIGVEVRPLVLSSCCFIVLARRHGCAVVAHRFFAPRVSQYGRRSLRIDVWKPFDCGTPSRETTVRASDRDAVPLPPVARTFLRQATTTGSCRRSRASLAFDTSPGLLLLDRGTHVCCT